MPKNKKTTRSVKTSNKSVDVNYLDRIESEIKSNQSTVSLVLGVLIVIVLAVLVFNYFNKNNKPAPEISTTNTEQNADVSPDSLPGKYTVKDGDTLFSIADKYYKDGYKYTEIVKANSLTNENTIQTGQVLEIPKLEAAASASPSENAMASSTPAPTEQAAASPTPSTDNGTGGGDNTVWGPNIHTDTYTVVEGDWLSTIAARAYGDIMAYDKIAKANNIADPNLIEPGMVLKLPR